MSEPIKAGDLCEVVWGLTGAASPNIGLIVRVLMYVGDEVSLGRIWRCEAEYGTRIQERAHVPIGQMDCAQSWLKKLPPDPTKLPTKELELTE